MNAAEPKSRLPLGRWGSLWPALRRPEGGPPTWLADAAVGAGLFGVLYAVVALATAGPGHQAGPHIVLDYRALPRYAAYSVARMAAAYALSLVFSLAYGYLAAYNRRAERVLLPLLDILQSVPILSFMPSVVLALTGLFPGTRLGVELASVVLVFTSQAWNMTFSFYSSLLTVPRELREVARMYRLSWWQRFRQLELPYATVGLVWNSMMSWAGGWFFLMAAEMFTLGDRSFQLPGLGSYLQAAVNAGDGPAIAAGLGVLAAVIVALDQLVWRPLIAWADKFKVEMVGNQTPPRSAVLILLRRSRLVEWLTAHVLAPVVERVDLALSRRPEPGAAAAQRPLPWRLAGWLAALVLAGLLAAAAWRGLGLLASIPAGEARLLPLATLLTALRVFGSLALSTLWTVPVGVTIGLSRAWAERLQPVVQILASFPATAVYPLLVLLLRGHLGWGSVLLMLLGTQWYVLFNVIAGAMSLPQDLMEAAALFGLGRLQRWRTLILPGIFPSLLTGLITAAGGAWNAAIVTEYVSVGGRTLATLGLGSLIAQASSNGDYGLLLGATLTLSLVVVLINRLFWKRLYRLAETRYSLAG
jgi:NitT/TauT family transport system permease protein